MQLYVQIWLRLLHNVSTMARIHQYIVLQYLGSEEANPSSCSIVISRAVNGSEIAANDAFQVHVPEQWDPSMSAEDLDYIEGLLEDWRSDFLDKSALFDRLNQLSTGPLRCTHSGVCDSDELVQVVKRFLS